MSREKWLMIFAVVIMITGTVQIAHSMIIPAKAWLSVHLINHAWAETVDNKSAVKPWPWMDSIPVAKITVPRLQKEFVVMRGVSGSVLAFTPGWHEGTNFPGEPGVSLISAHRDTHFSFLRYIQPGDVFTLETQDGVTKSYAVSELSVVEEAEMKVPLADNRSTILLSTCYPFNDWQPGGEMRFVVVAHETEGKIV